MYGINNAKTLEKLVKMVQVIHSRQSLIEGLFTGQSAAAYEAYSQMYGKLSIQHYVINLMLYLHTIKDKYIEIYNKFISQLHIYAKAVRILAKGYLPISLIMPLTLQEILVKKPYIALNLETYINICQQELATCKRIGYEFYCEELFVVRYKSIHHCESAIYFGLDRYY